MEKQKAQSQQNRHNVVLAPDHWEKLEAIAKKQRISVSAVLRMWLEKELNPPSTQR